MEELFMKIKKIVFIAIMIVSLLGCENTQNKQSEEEEQVFFNSIQDEIASTTTSKTHSVNSANDYSERDDGYAIKLLEISIYYNELENIDIQDVLDNFRENLDMLVLRKNYDLMKISFLIENSNDFNDSEIFYEYLNYTNTFAEGDNVLSTKDLDTIYK